ncbi:hypothetical protein EVAR_92980_1 [Eumeta japonica]|uniref:Uncharacterized protein n=1 Tax=Eumeta variegata TaxID=151549 RepID=A0A4C1TAG5_EUMVA|nr:hypothetical protein EVAR_92980_1 [Eumeta japonica]
MQMTPERIGYHYLLFQIKGLNPPSSALAQGGLERLKTIVTKAVTRLRDHGACALRRLKLKTHGSVRPWSGTSLTSREL